jgi:hypothetical protein
MRQYQCTAAIVGETLLKYGIPFDDHGSNIYLTNGKKEPIAVRLKDPTSASKQFKGMVYSCSHGTQSDSSPTNILVNIKELIRAYLDMRNWVPTTIIFLTDMLWSGENVVKDIALLLAGAKKEFEKQGVNIEDCLTFQFVLFGCDSRGYENFSTLNNLASLELVVP